MIHFRRAHEASNSVTNNPEFSPSLPNHRGGHVHVVHVFVESGGGGGERLNLKPLLNENRANLMGCYGS